MQEKSTIASKKCNYSIVELHQLSTIALKELTCKIASKERNYAIVSESTIAQLHQKIAIVSK